MGISVTILVLVLLALWLYQVVFLMMMEDDLFPGQYDKLIWGAMFVFAAPLAPIAFIFWRRATLARMKDEKPPVPPAAPAAPGGQP